MSKLPILWSAGVMKDDASYISFSLKQVEIKFRGANAQIDMIRSDMEALRDVLTVALQPLPAKQ
jgi:hypothetical protein